MLVPLILLLSPTDVTVRVAAEQSVQTGVTDPGSVALVTGGEAAVEARALGPESTAGIRARGLYGRLFSLSPITGAGAPTDTLSAEVSGDAGFQLTPRLHLTLDTQSYLSDRAGVRATDALAARDPFLDGSRLAYTIGGALSLFAAVSRRATMTLGGGYSQAGALAASRPEAVGVDAHAPRGSLGLLYELGPSDTLTPELRYSFTHFYHALYDVELHRGPADIHALTALANETHAFTRRLEGGAGLGFTLATPPPILRSRAPVASPEARLSLRYLTHRARIVAGYTYGFTSLGPRIGFGSQHSGSVEVTYRPLPGARYRDLRLLGVFRAALGVAKVAANPPLRTGPAPPPPATGTVSTTTLAAGGRVEVPLRRGFALFGGLDLEILRGAVDPPPSTGSAGPQLLTVVTLGIAGTLSTDPSRTVRPDPEEEDDEARRRQSKTPQESPDASFRRTPPDEGAAPLPDR